ncbi:MAG TPA: DUF3824 domain-containing protein [Ktedonobacteraceae bacterium]|nr:DUF3824 domain-containing protein [Ktedonobacteraceae bacterium]
MYYDPNQPPQQPQANPYEVPPTQYAGPNPYEIPPTQYAGPSNNPQQYGTPPYNPAQYAPPPVPGYAQVPQQPKRSLRWLWITLSIIGGVLVLSCAGCVIASAMGYNFLKTSVVGPTEVANSYYQAIENQDYSQAYGYLANNMQTTSGQTLSQNLYATAAQGKDTTDGLVTNFTQTNFSNNNGVAAITMTVTRSGSVYDVHLKLQQNSSGTWQITQYDDI